MKPLSEQELREKIEEEVEILHNSWFEEDYDNTDPNALAAIKSIVQIFTEDRKAYGEQVMEYAKMKINKYSIHAPRGYPKGTLARRQLLGSLDNWMNKKQRNQGEKTDE